MSVSVFNYRDVTQFLRDSLVEKQQRNPQFSIRSWSTQMGFRHHSSLVNLLQGKRPVRPQHIPQLVKGLKLDFEEEDFFRHLVYFQNAPTPEEKQSWAEKLSHRAPVQDFDQIDLDRFALVSSWLHSALIEMTELQDFRFDPRWIRSRLSFEATEAEIIDAWNRLLTLKLVRLVGHRFEKTHQHLTTPINRGSEAIREHHKQVIRHALDAIESQPKTERILNAATLTIDSKRLPEVEQLIYKFRQELTALAEVSGGDQTYQLCLQFYRVTQTTNEGEKKCTR